VPTIPPNQRARSSLCSRHSIYAEGEFRDIVAHPRHVHGSHDIEVIIEQRQDMVGTQIDALARARG
jgi:hypothetical protein